MNRAEAAKRAQSPGRKITYVKSNSDDSGLMGFNKSSDSGKKDVV